MKTIPLLSEAEFTLFQKYLVSASGFYFKPDRLGALSSLLYRRLETTGCDSYRAYYNLLVYSPQGEKEQRLLLDSITVGETYFFRDGAQFEILTRFILPEIAAKKGRLPHPVLRIWSAGCSRGAEAYSIAMAVSETLPAYKDWHISILGTDLNRQVLSSAAEGVYTQRDVQYLSGVYREKYFQRTGGNYRLDPQVKKMVDFRDHNLVRDGFDLEQMRDLDIIFCRNVSIYFDWETTRRIVEKFYHCLNAEGWLFIGYAETLWRITDKFRTVEFPKGFIYKKAQGARKQEPARPFVCVPDITPAAWAVGERGAQAQKEEKQPTEPPGPYETAVKLFLKKEYEQALALFDDVILRDAGHPGAHLGRATILANQSKYEEAIASLTQVIARDNLSAEAYYLLGVLWQKTGDLAQAEVQFKKVIYVDPGIELAFFNLGNIYLYQGRYRQAALEFGRAAKLLEKRPGGERVRFCDDLTVEFLSDACQNNLAEIAKKEAL